MVRWMMAVAMTPIDGDCENIVGVVALVTFPSSVECVTANRMGGHLWRRIEIQHL